MRLRSETGLVVLAVVVLALLPLSLATWVFGRSYQASEVGRADARLVAGSGVAVQQIRAATLDAERSAAAQARSPSVQAALARGDVPEFASTVGGRWVQVTAGVGPASPPPADTLARTALVSAAGRTIGHVTATVRLDPLLQAVSRRTGVETVAVRAGVVRGGALAGTPITGPSGTPYDTRLAGTRYRALRQPLGEGRTLALLVPYGAIGATILHRQLLTFGAGGLTLLALVVLAVVLLPRRRSLVHPLRGVRGRRNPLALVGDVAVAAHDPHALLPVILEAAVVSTQAAGGRVVWNGREIASLGERAEQPALSLTLEEAGESPGAWIELYPGRQGLAKPDREVVESLVAQGRIALENARLQGIVRRQAETDELTDLANRRRFMERLHQEIARSERFGSPLSLVLFDLDRFKRINDRCGHQVGDTVLRETADVIRRRIREIDLAARIGGEEFAVILPGSDLSGAARLAEHLRRDIERSVVVRELGWHATASFGVATFHPDEEADMLIGAADRALYRAKAAGRNAVRAADDPAHAGNEVA